jgi:hypothetical protein
MVWFVIYCFPYALPTDAATMNYACLLWGGFTVFISLWWFFGARRDYEGPPVVHNGGRVSVAETIKKGSVHRASHGGSVRGGSI